MKKLTILIVLSLSLAVCQGQSPITLTPFVGESLNVVNSPDRQTFIDSLFEAIIYGKTQVGPIGHPASFTLAGTTSAAIHSYQIIKTDYHSWGETVNPPNPPFRDQYGGGMIIGAHVVGNGIDKFMPNSITYDQVSTDQYGIFTDKSTTGNLSFDPTYMWGWNGEYNTDGSKKWIKNGSMVPVNELIFYQVESIYATGSGTDEQVHRQTMGYVKDPFNVNLTISFKGSQDMPDARLVPFEAFTDPMHIYLAPQIAEPAIKYLLMGGAGVFGLTAMIRKQRKKR